MYIKTDTVLLRHFQAALCVACFFVSTILSAHPATISIGCSDVEEYRVLEIWFDDNTTQELIVTTSTSSKVRLKIHGGEGHLYLKPSQFPVRVQSTNVKKIDVWISETCEQEKAP
ncbi:hypothetical protein [Vibrio maritimus]|uniref:hypothetical protein n=1 Tax=Vibrio maritimus TaxID=990268 RepID=UPI0037355B65